VADAQAAITAADVVPKGYVLDWGGQFENLAEASARSPSSSRSCWC
jgi:Cu/Ag efflux pump CusA